MLRQPGGGTVEVWLDGVAADWRIPLDARRVEPTYFEVEAEGDEPHMLELRTIAPGEVRVCGVVAERAQPGVTYDALGIDGARASRPLAWDWEVLARQLRRRDPDLIIISYGTNEVGDPELDLARYRRDFAELLGRLRQAAPRASLLVIAPPDRAARTGKRWRTISAVPGLVAAQRAAAFEAGAAFWDLYYAMGGSGAIQRWASRSAPLAQADRVHLTRSGYQQVAEAFYRELLGSYLRHLWRTIWGIETARVTRMRQISAE
jgi:lysophospholipase L1-like esterase